MRNLVLLLVSLMLACCLAQTDTDAPSEDTSPTVTEPPTTQSPFTDPTTQSTFPDTTTTSTTTTTASSTTEDDSIWAEDFADAYCDLFGGRDQRKKKHKHSGSHSDSNSESDSNEDDDYNDNPNYEMNRRNNCEFRCTEDRTREFTHNVKEGTKCSGKSGEGTCTRIDFENRKKGGKKDDRRSSRMTCM